MLIHLYLELGFEDFSTSYCIPEFGLLTLKRLKESRVYLDSLLTLSPLQAKSMINKDFEGK